MTGERALPITANPYVGPRAFEEQERDYFFGRDEETTILVGLVMARRATLFFAQSGAGKSSLIRAGLIPEVTRQQTIQLGRRTHTTQKMQVLPIMNVGGVPLNKALPADANLYIFNALYKLLPAVSPAVLAGLNLAAGLAQYTVDQAVLPAPLFSTTDSANATLLIFDQFEELFTAYAARRAEQADFFQQVNHALATYANLHVLFSMREDYIAELTPYANLLPEQLRHRYRLERLKRPAALLAVREPAARAGRSYADGVAESLVDNLARTQIRREQQQLSGDSTTPIPLIGDEVEPVHLQIVCRQLWANLPADHQTIQAQDVQDFGDVDRALRDFYTTSLQQTVAQTGVSERRLRDWFTEHLITPARTRGLVYRDDSKGVSAGLPNAAVDQLRDAYLIRANLRGGDTWYELAHDRLIEPVLAANQAWLVQYEYDNPLLATTRLWLQSERDPAHLLRDPQLSIAQQFMAAHAAELLEEEREFLDESLQLQTIEQQAAARHRIILVISLLIGFVLLGLIVWIVLNLNQQATLARARQLAAESALAQQSDNLDVGMLLAIEAGRIAPTTETYNALHQAFNQQGRTTHILSDHKKAVTQLAWSPDGTRLLSTSMDGTARIWTTDGVSKSLTLFSFSDQRVNGGAWNHTGTQILTYGHAPTVRIWDAATGRLLFAREAHTPTVTFSTWYTDGTRFLTTGDDGFVRFWDTKHNAPLFALTASTATVAYAVWNRTGDRLLTAGADNIARVWDPVSASVTLTLPGHKKGGMQVALWNRDESRILTASSDGTVRVWDASNGDELLQLVHNGKVSQAAWSQYELRILTASFDEIVRVWDAKSGAPLLTLPSQEDWVLTALWSKDEQRILTAGTDMPVQVWDAQSGVRLNQLDVQSGEVFGAYQVAWNNATNQVATGSPTGEVRIWQLSMGEELPTLQHFPVSPIITASWNDDGSKILTAAEDGSAYVWEAETGHKITLAGHTQKIFQARWSADELYILTASADGTARIWDAKTGTQQAMLDSPDMNVEFARWDDNGKLLLTGESNLAQHLFRVRIWDATDLAVPLATLAHAQRIQTVRGDKDFKRLVTASLDGKICLWNMPRGEKIYCRPHVETVTDPEKIGVREAIWNDDSSLILSYSDDGTARIWDAQTLKAKFTFRHDSPVTAASWNTDESLLLTASKDGTARIWDARSGVLLVTLDNHVGNEVRFAVWNKTGTRILTADDDGAAFVWDATGILRLPLLGHSEAINGIIWSPDESMILTYSDDKTARLWDAKTGNLISVLTGHSEPIRLARWNTNGTRILTASEDGTVRQYYVHMEDLLHAACESVPRNLTPEEWQRYFGDKKHELTCDNRPAGSN